MNADEVFESLTLVKELRTALHTLGVASLGDSFRYPMENKETRYYKYGSVYVASSQYAGKPHPGVDFAGPAGSLVYVVGDGEVVVAREDPRGYGKYIMLEHRLATPNKDRAWTLYAHLTSTGGLKVGDRMYKDDVVGLQGTTGNSGGVAHLHFEAKRTDQLSLFAQLSWTTLHRYYYDPYTFLDLMRFVAWED